MATRPAFHPGLNAHYRPSDTVEAMALALESDGVPVTRMPGGGFVVGDRISPAMAAALARASFTSDDIEATLATQAMERAA